MRSGAEREGEFWRRRAAEVIGRPAPGSYPRPELPFPRTVPRQAGGNAPICPFPAAGGILWHMTAPMRNAPSKGGPKRKSAAKGVVSHGKVPPTVEGERLAEVVDYDYADWKSLAKEVAGKHLIGSGRAGKELSKAKPHPKRALYADAHKRFLASVALKARLVGLTPLEEDRKAEVLSVASFQKKASGE